MRSFPDPLLIGMVHLPALPGNPANRLAMEDIIAGALTDARVLEKAGFRMIMAENFGDAPFRPDRLEPATVAAMTVVARELILKTGLSVGVNCLRNDAVSALGIAAAAGATCIRVNVHIGVSATDQGLIEGRAHETVCDRQRLCPDVRILADVHVKHATPVSQPDIALAAEETAYRGKADGLIVTGTTTGRSADVRQLAIVKKAVPDRPVLAGSGVTAGTIKSVLEVADGAIVGSSLKPGGDCAAPIDPNLARQFINSAIGT